MDRKELMFGEFRKILSGFVTKCAELGRPVEIDSFVPMFPGVSDTKYVTRVILPSMKNTAEASEFLVDVLFSTTTPEERISGPLALYVYKNKEEVEPYRYA
jgi:hypothetical protein